MRRFPSVVKRFGKRTPHKAKSPQFEILEGRALLATFTVVNTNDAGPGSLREAIINANSSPNFDNIFFNIGQGGVQTISLLSPLNPITDLVQIDGTTQPGFAGSPIIELDGSGAGTPNGLTITAANSTVRGLVINRFAGSGIILNGGGNNLIVGNYIGTDVTGAVDLGNGFGVVVRDGSNNTIGGTTPGARNVISGNGGSGILVSSGATGNLVQGNFIGTDATGAVDLGNELGVSIFNSSNNTIGGTTPEARNIISGNDFFGIEIASGSSGNVVQGNYIGTDVNGTAALGNLNYGVRIESSPNNTIGGTAPAAGNVLSGNLIGVAVLGQNSTGNRILGNLIGTDRSGMSSIGNVDDGVFIANAPGNIVGGTTPSARNVISGNRGDGVELNVLGATNNTIQGNYIGVDVTGGRALGNTFNGVRIPDGINNLVGGTAPGAGNVISGNGQVGIELWRNASGNSVQGNFIGTDPNGTLALANGAQGVWVRVGASNNLIGGATPGSRNLIAFNASEGVLVEAGSGNSILGNSIFSNNGLGIALGLDGVTPNDAGDADAGANDLQNFPVLTAAILSGGTTTISGILNSTSNSAFRIEFFSDTALDPTAFGEGRTFLGSTTVATGPGGDAAFSFVVNAALTGSFITATAMDSSNNTSEFSRGVRTNTPPLAVGDTFSTPEDTTLVVAAPGVLGNDSDIERDSLTAVLVAGPSSGTLIPNADGSFTYTPNPNFNGTDSFTYRAVDSLGGVSNTATVTLTVIAVNDPPTVARPIADTVVNQNASPVTRNLSGVFADVDIATNGDRLSFDATSSDPGLVGVQLNGETLTLSFVQDRSGAATVTVRATDLANRAVPTTFRVVVNPVISGTPEDRGPRSDDDLFDIRLAPNDPSRLQVQRNQEDPIFISLIDRTGVTIDGGQGDDTFNIRLGNPTLVPGRSFALVVSGGTGNDQMNVFGLPPVPGINLVLDGETTDPNAPPGGGNPGDVLDLAGLPRSARIVAYNDPQRRDAIRLDYQNGDGSAVTGLSLRNFGRTTGLATDGSVELVGDSGAGTAFGSGSRQEDRMTVRATGFGQFIATLNDAAPLRFTAQRLVLRGKVLDDTFEITPLAGNAWGVSVEVEGSDPGDPSAVGPGRRAGDVLTLIDPDPQSNEISVSNSGAGGGFSFARIDTLRVRPAGGAGAVPNTLSLTDSIRGNALDVFLGASGIVDGSTFEPILVLRVPGEPDRPGIALATETGNEDLQLVLEGGGHVVNVVLFPSGTGRNLAVRGTGTDRVVVKIEGNATYSKLKRRVRFQNPSTRRLFEFVRVSYPGPGGGPLTRSPPRTRRSSWREGGGAGPSAGAGSVPFGVRAPLGGRSRSRASRTRTGPRPGEPTPEGPGWRCESRRDGGPRRAMGTIPRARHLPPRSSP